MVIKMELFVCLCNGMWFNILSHLVDALHDCAKIPRAQFSIFQEKLVAIYCGTPQFIWVCVWTLVYLRVHWHGLWWRNYHVTLEEQWLTFIWTSADIQSGDKLREKPWINSWRNITNVDLSTQMHCKIQLTSNYALWCNKKNSKQNQLNLMCMYQDIKRKISKWLWQRVHRGTGGRTVSHKNCSAGCWTVTTVASAFSSMRKTLVKRIDRAHLTAVMLMH